MATYISNQETHALNQIHMDHYHALAQGNFGMITLEAHGATNESTTNNNDLVMNENTNLKSYNDLIEHLYFYDTKVGIQINNAAELSPNDKRFAKEYSEIEINKAIKDFKKSLYYTSQTNIDYIEVYGAHGYFLDQIVSDRVGYNCVLQKKKDIVLEIVNYAFTLNKPIGIRINVNDEKTEYVENIFSNLIYWYEILKDIESKFEYISITTKDFSRVGEHFNFKPTKLAKETFKITPLITTSGVSTYEDAQQMENYVAAICIGVSAMKNPNILYSLAKSRSEMNDTKF